MSQVSQIAIDNQTFATFRTTLNSSLNAINALKSEGYNVMGMLSIFSYNFQYYQRIFLY